jgi:peptide/nickel transport system permease protein
VLRFVLAKIGVALVTLILAVTLAFLLGRLAGDPVANLLGPLAPREQVEAMRQELGLDRPLPEQLLATFGDLARGELGTSLRYNQSNLEIILSRFPASLQLAVAAITIALVVGVPVGVFAALRENTLPDRLLMSGALVGQSLPLYWLGMMLVLVFSVQLGWLPAARSGTWQHLVLPALTLSTLPLARVARLTRSSVSEVLSEDYITAARARGLREGRVVVIHTLRNAALPVITLIGLQVGILLSGSVTVEVVFAWPGLGALAVDAVSFRDFPLVQSIVVFGALVFVTVNLLVDLAYGWIDPRIRGQGA